MIDPVCPTSHTFYCLRRVLEQELHIDKKKVRPQSCLESLIPESERRRVWKALRREGLELPPLSLSQRLRRQTFWHVLHMLASLAASLQNWALFFLTAPFGLFGWWLVTRPWATHIEHVPITIRDAVIYLTPFREGVRQGYRWSHDEISTKVRLILSVNLGIPLNEVRPEKSFKELGC
jgi:hypothetical protein